MKNRLLIFFARVLSLFVTPSWKPKHVLVVSTTGLGDTMWATPALRALKKAGYTVGMLTGPYGKELFASCPYIDTLHTVGKRRVASIVSLYRALRKGQYESILVFHASQRPLFPLLALTKPKQLLGFAKRNKGLDRLFSVLVEQKHTHEILLREAMLKQLGVSSDGSLMELFVKEREKEKAIVLIPGSKDAFKRWPKEYFKALGNRIRQETTLPIHVLGTSDEAELVSDVAGAIDGAVPIYDEPLADAINRIRHAQCVISNDTGTMHVAFAASVPTIGLFCPTDPVIYGPLGVANAAVIERRPACFACRKRKCSDNFCMRQIAPNEVFEEAKRWLT